MAAFFIILGVPLLGILLSFSEHARQTAGTPGGRFVARNAVLIFGATLGLAGVYVLASTVVWILEGRHGGILTSIVAFVAQVFAGLLMLWAGRSALRVYRLPLRLDSSAGDLQALQYERTSQELQLSASALVLAPLLLLGVFGILILIPLFDFGVTVWATRRARQAQFLWTMALAVRQNLPLADEVDEFAEPLWVKQKRAYHNLSSRLRDGQSLGQALEMCPGILSRPLASELRIAEEAGTLPQVLTEMATQTTSSLSRSQNDSAIAITLVYAWVLLTTFVAVISFIMYWIIPKYKDIFNDFGVELPPMTVSLIRAADSFFGENFLFLVPLVGLPIILALIGAAVYFLEWGNLNVPLLMRWFPRRDAPALLRSLSHAVSASQPLPEVVAEMSHRHLRSDMRKRLAAVSSILEQGEPLWSALSTCGFVRPAEADALAAAQRANNLPWAMRTLADSIDRTFRHRSQFWLEILKPTVVVGVGLIVAWFVVAMFLPLVKLINALA